MTNAYRERSDVRRLVRRPLVSIVMPTYNHERYLAEAIDGVMAQKTDASFELIVSDDCSKDRTREIALDSQQKYPHAIRVLTSDEWVGMHGNDARVFASVRGRYIAFCEGDDYWHRPEKLEEQVALLESESGISLTCSSWRIVSDGGSLISDDVLALSRTRLHPLGLIDILNGRVKTVTVCTRTALIKQALRESPLCRPGRYPFGDAPLWVEANCAGSCVCFPEDFATYRLSDQSVTRPRDTMDVYRFIAGTCEFDRDVLELYPPVHAERLALEARVRATRIRLRALALMGETQGVREELVRLGVLDADVHLRERLLYLGSRLSETGTFGAATRRWILEKWHSLARRRVTPIVYIPAPRETTESVDTPVLRRKALSCTQ